jgi:hypothetical protein
MNQYLPTETSNLHSQLTQLQTEYNKALKEDKQFSVLKDLIQKRKEIEQKLKSEKPD